jgi:phage FluMu gp28-like protein
MSLNTIIPRWNNLQQAEYARNQEELAKTQKLTEDPTDFFRHVLGFEPTTYQQELIKLFQENQFIAARWSRQSGKSWIISALLLWYAATHPNSYIAVVGPSWRQTKHIISRRITPFLHSLPHGTYFQPHRTYVRLKNGSVIEAYPNNPETIRGPTLNVVYCDEMNFLPNDQEMYDAILFTLSATNGKFVCTSTPWTSDSIFWKIFNHHSFADFAKHHITWEQAVEPNGPLKRTTLEKIKKQFAEDPSRWKREMEAEWAEDQDVWLPQSLITKCIDGKQDLYQFDTTRNGKFYAGLDLGKHRDYSVLVVTQENEGKNQLRLWKIFPLGTKYATVIGYVKSLTDRWRTIERIRVDVTGVGEYIVEDMKNANIENVEPITFTAQRKQELASLLKQRMLNDSYKFPFTQFRLSPTVIYSYVAELNVERFALRKDGTIGFSHPQGQHDDTFWSTCLAVSCSIKLAPEPFFGATPQP